VAAFGRAKVDPGVPASEVYRGAATVVMRLIFLFFAEESALLPADNEIYSRSYSATGLYSELEQLVAEASGNEAELDHTYLAWHRILALFLIVYQGVSHRKFSISAHDGSMFDPSVYSWLPLAVDDRTVLHILRSVQAVSIGGELRRVSFSTLTVEQIGYIYEGLLSFEAYRATEVVIGLTGKAGHEEEIALRHLEPLTAVELADRYKKSGIGSSRALAQKLTPLNGEDRTQAETRLYAVTRDHALVQRLLPFYRIIRKDLRGDPVVIVPGALYVTESTLRSRSGTHYTPRHLAEQVAEGALEPLVYSPGPLHTADQSQWKRRPAEEILSLKVADVAMGSGAFLVAACRYLAGQVIEAWSAEGNADAKVVLSAAESESRITLDVTADPLVIKARRLVIQHCLYGADINPMAVEIGKLALWLISMDPDRPFTFVDDRLVVGDSLLGITSVDQLEWMHLDPQSGRELHRDTLFDFLGDIQALLRDVAWEREHLVDIQDDEIADIHKKRRILTETQTRTETLIRYADLLVGAALAGVGNWVEAARIANEAAASGSFAELERQSVRWLRTDQPDGAFDRSPVHWPLVFPEVFSRDRPNGPGFDAVIGNPPFLGGPKLRPSLGAAYREYLSREIAHNVRGTNTDLIAYFVLRVHTLLNSGGQIGLVATNTVAQGDTREVGLDQIVASGTEIREAVKSEPWPSKSAALEYAAVWTSRAPLDGSAKRLVDGLVVKCVNSSLDPASRVAGNPRRLAANQGIAFLGHHVNGMGFVMTQAEATELEAQDPDSAAVIHPYLVGQDLNQRPDCTASRWIVNFHDWDLSQAARYTAALRRIETLVKPEREQRNRESHRKYWWRYADYRRGLEEAIARRERVVVITLVSKVVMPVMVPTGQVFAHKLGVFATDDTGMLALLSSAPHYWWAITHSSTMKADLNYSPSDVFETLPLSEINEEMRQFGDRLDTFRRELMLARNAGLTATYNLVHDPACHDADIEELREIHQLIDEAVVRTYGWHDLLEAGLDHGFHYTRQGTRYTIGPASRREILDRLLELNHARHADEVNAGLHVNRAKKTTASDGDTLF